MNKTSWNFFQMKSWFQQKSVKQSPGNPIPSDQKLQSCSKKPIKIKNSFVILGILSENDLAEDVSINLGKKNRKNNSSPVALIGSNLLQYSWFRPVTICFSRIHSSCLSPQRNCDSMEDIWVLPCWEIQHKSSKKFQKTERSKWFFR